MAKEKTSVVEAVDGKFEEFRDFILENRDVIVEILREIPESVDLEKAKDNPVNKALRRGAESAEDMARETFRAITSKEVQIHFVRMGLEFFMGMEALLKALPLPGILGDAYEEADAAVVRLGETICENNPNCLYRKNGKADGDGAPKAKGTPKRKAAPKRKAPQPQDGLEKIELG